MTTTMTTSSLGMKRMTMRGGKGYRSPRAAGRAIETSRATTAMKSALEILIVMSDDAGDGGDVGDDGDGGDGGEE